MEIEYIKKQLMDLSKRAYLTNEVPVGALLVKDGKIVSKAYNKREATYNPLHHAEILCIIKETRKQKYWRLNGYSMYVTLEPCEMCKKVIEACGIKDVHYFVKSNSIKSKIKTEYKKEMDSVEYEELIKNFFKKIRKE